MMEEQHLKIGFDFEGLGLQMSFNLEYMCLKVVV